MAQNDTLLEGLKVVDLGQDISAPYCTRMMTALGATVIKVEPPKGDTSRRVGPFPDDGPDPERSGMYHYLNGGKRGVTLDLSSEDDRKVIKKLAAWGDVIVENFPPSFLPSLGLGYETLRSVNERVILTSITSFGQSGPYRDYAADEIGIQAISGLMDIAGEPQRAPLKKGGNFTQYHGAVNAFSGTLAALYERESTGEGQHVDVSLAESFTCLHGRVLKIYSYTGEVVHREGAQGRAFPGGIYPCNDGYIVFTAGGRRWDDFVAMVGVPELADPRFRDPESRARLADELNALFLPWLANHSKEEVFHLAQAHGIPAGSVCTAPDMLSSPQLKSREFFVDVPLPGGESVPMPGLPYQFSNVAAPQIGRGPLLGEHNQEVYCGILGLSQESLVILRQSGTI